MIEINITPLAVHDMNTRPCAKSAHRKQSTASAEASPRLDLPEDLYTVDSFSSLSSMVNLPPSLPPPTMLGHSGPKPLRPLNLAYFSALLRGQIRSRNLDAADNTWARMIACGVKPNVATYSLLINGCIKAGKFSRIPCHFREMKEAGLKPDVILCNTLLKSCEKQEPVQTALALDIFNTMPQYGQRPDIVTFTTLITILGRARQPQRCIQCFEDMRAADILPDMHSYGALMTALRNNGQPRYAMVVYESIFAAGRQPNDVVCNVAIQCLVDLGDLMRVEQLWQQMLQRNTVGGITCAIVLNALQNHGLWRESQEVLITAARRRFNLSVRQVMPVLESWVREDKLEQATSMARSFIPRRDMENINGALQRLFEQQRTHRWITSHVSATF